MNHCVPNWNIMDEPRQPPQLLPASEQKTFMGPDPELAELLWRNGQVIMSSQTLRKPSTTTDETSQVQKPDQQQSQAGGSPTFCGSLIQADETSSWFHYSIDENLEKEFPFFCDIPSMEPAKEPPSSQSKTILKQYNNLSLEEGHVSPTKLPDGDAPVAAGANLSNGRLPNFSFFSAEKMGFRGGVNGVQEGREPSMVTVGSSHCGSNQVQNEGNYSRVSGMFARPDAVDAHKKAPQNDKKNNNDTMETTLTSSSGGSGGSLARTGKQAHSNHSHKRKGRDADEFESHSEEAEYESVEASKLASKTTSARRSRAAEVHNLSERRRRDRINEKMRALQELIPHCNKTDKASMLDEAIEYLKSLQLQVQFMWMGNGMAPMMYPGVQHYIPRMGMAMNPTALASLHGHLQMPRVPMVDPSVSSSGAPNPSMCQPQLLNPMNFQQMHGANLPEAYARYLGFHSMPMGQAVNLFPYGSQTVQANQNPAAPSSSGGPCNVGVSSENPQNGNLG